MKRRHIIAIIVSGIVVIFLFVMFLKCIPHIFLRPRNTPVSPEEIFARHVLDPIPKSVTSIKVDQPSKTLGYLYTFHFNISREDLALIINLQSFIRIWNLKYKNGCIDWDWDHTGTNELKIAKYSHSMPLYEIGGRPHRPLWFRPELWDNPEAYAFYKVGEMVNIQVFEHDGLITVGRETLQVLLYNEKEGEAYFIVSDREYK